MITRDDKPSTLDRPIIKILLLDYDNCLATINTWEKGVKTFNGKNKFLSSRVVDLAKKGGYQGFIGVTHRSCYAFSPVPDGGGGITENRYVMQSNSFGQAYNYKHYFTYAITDHFTAATSIPCLAVSSIDDYSQTAPKANPCGYGYEFILKPYEEQVQADLMKYDDIFPRDKDDHLPIDQAALKKIPNSKNTQIVQSIQLAKDHFAKKFTGIKPILEFHFLDDIKAHCENINSIKNLLPPDVILKSFQHAEFEQIYADTTNPLVTIDTVVKSTLAEQLTVAYRTKELPTAQGPASSVAVSLNR